MSDKLKPSEFKRSVEVLKEQKEYWAWAKRARFYLRTVPDALDILEGRKGCPADTSEDREARERWIQLDAELMAALAGGVSDDVLKKAIKEVARHIYNHYALQQSSTELEDIMSALEDAELQGDITPISAYAARPFINPPLGKEDRWGMGGEGLLETEEGAVEIVEGKALDPNLVL
ncbi:hypothetical protein M427DRAFT_32195 [Gonapodya prolifera JEL478]|uniref:Uncharacterized protein n=1 Tax=Gonapodya prolifera (strain JEL478) TaxID=1344416 RepID=A0A139AFB2_GONPJ|nr:hypothetical protein M427DRAFT_32195 [Gonapodya prolifera JEL478]|eukprot:KXS15496.1 hypothetical protein M427DRAFT_32195 [Gonapodya prolifera JEL478]